MSELRDVYWLVTPLAVFGDKKKSLTKRSKIADVDDPDRYRSLTWALHWAIQVGDLIYETSPTEKVERKMSDLKKFKIFSNITARVVESSKWSELREKLHLHVRRRKVGQTSMTSAQIEEQANSIWSGFGKQDYHPLVRNCQNFARLLFQTITLKPGEYGVADTERATWEPMDEPVSHNLSDISQSILKTTGGVTITALYVATLADIAETNNLDQRLLADAAESAKDFGERAIAGMGAKGAAETEELGEGAAETAEEMGADGAVEAGSVGPDAADLTQDGGTAIEIVGDSSDVADAVQNTSEVVDVIQDASDVVDTVQDASDVVDAVQNTSDVIDAVQDASDFADAAQNASNVADAVSGAPDILTNSVSASDIGGGAAAAAGAGGSAAGGTTTAGTAGTAAEGGAVANTASAAGSGSQAASQTAAGASKGAAGAGKGAAGASKGVAGTGKGVAGLGKGAAGAGKGAAGAGKIKGFVAASKGALAAKGAAATGASGKVGLTAKAAAISHSAMYGTGAAKLGTVGAGMTKMGPKVVLVHPIAGVTIIATGAGLVYLTRRGRKDIKYSEKEAQKRRDEHLRQFKDLEGRDQERGGKDSKWLQRMQDLVQKSDSTSVSQFDFEDVLYGFPKEPNVELEQSEMDALAKDLEMSRVDSAPEVLEEASTDERASSRTDPKRSGTT